MKSTEIIVHLDGLDLSEAFRRAVAESRLLAEDAYRITVTLKSIDYDDCLDPGNNEYDFTFSCAWQE